MAAPPHYGSSPLSPEPPQQYPSARGNNNPSSDEVVVFFQNYHNRPGMSMPPQAPLPPPPLHQPTGGKGSCSRGPLSPFPLNFPPLPPRPLSSMNEHEAAAYFLAHMNETSNDPRDLSQQAGGSHPRDTHAGGMAHQTDRGVASESSVLRNLNNETVATRNNNIVEDQNIPVSSRESVQNQNLPVASRDSAHSNKTSQSHNPSTSSRNPMSNQNLPLNSGNSAVRQQHTDDSLKNQNHAMSSANSLSHQRDTPASLPSSDNLTQEEEGSLISGHRINSSDDEDELERQAQAVIPAQVSSFNVELILSKPRRRMTAEEKIIFNRLKHPLKPPCKCGRKCYEKINEERRKVINFSFWGLNYVERSMFLLGHVKRTKTNRKTVRGLSRRRFSLKYNMLDENNKLHSVCKIFFVATLGLVSDKCITQLFLKNPVGTLVPQGDMRGKHKPANKIDTSLIKMHIEAYCKQFPVPSKNKNLHIPSGISKMQMYKDFRARVKNYKCGASRYAQVVKEMNVVFGRKKPPKNAKTDASLPSQVGIGSASNNNRHNQNNNFNRIGNFTIPGGQDSQGLMIPPHSQMPLWEQIDQHVNMLQNQFGDSGASGCSSPGNSNSNNPSGNSNRKGSSSSQNYSVTAPPPGLMPLPGFVVPPHLDSSNPASKSGCENCLACRLERQNAALEAAEAREMAELQEECAQADYNMSQQQGSSTSQINPAVPNQQSRPANAQPVIQSRPTNAQPVAQSRSLDSQSNIPTLPPQAISSILQQTIPAEQDDPTHPTKLLKFKRPRNEEERIAVKRLKYPLLPPCNCPRKCREKITEERRQQINYLYWGLQYQMRAMFLLNHIKQSQAKRHTLAPGEPSRRKFSRSYFFPDDQDNLQSVCKVFFLHTLGFTTDSVITKLMRKNPIGTVVPVAVDRRGKNSARSKKKLDTKPITDHIKSHMRKYKGKYRLPADINIRRMWKDFKLRNADAKCAYETYRQLVKEIRGNKKGKQQQASIDTSNHPAAHPSAARSNVEAVARATAATSAASSISAAVSRDNAAVSRDSAAVSRGSAVSRDNASVYRESVAVSRDSTVSRDNAAVYRDNIAVSRDNAVSRDSAVISRDSAAAAAAAAAHSAVVMDMLRLIDA